MLTTVLNWIAGLPPLLLLAVGIPMLLKGADWLVDGAVAIARGLGVSPLLIGLTVVAFGTSAPELAVNLIAAVNDAPGLSFGNIIGSNIANIGLVIGLAALVAPIDVHGRVITKELPVLLVISIAAAALAYLPATAVVGADGAALPGFSRFDGWAMLGSFVVFCGIWFRAARRDAADPLAREAIEQTETSPKEPVGLATFVFIGGLVVLVAGAKLTEVGARGLAEAMGFSETLIGLTVVAIATSLPEIATTVVAARKGEADLAVGNVVGSNLFNLLLVLGLTSAIAEVPLPDAWATWDFSVMVAFTVLLWIVATTHRRTVNRMEGTLLLALYTGYLVFTIVRERV